MKRTAAICVTIVFSLVCCAYADFGVTDSGTWSKSWPKELEPLRKQARTFEGPKDPLLHYAIPFTNRDEFESAWPHLLKIKSKGAPIVLRRGPSFWLGDKATAGVCVHTPPAGQDPITDGKGNWEKTISIELIVDGEIIDLNRIPLPDDTPIIDERFKGGAISETPVARYSGSIVSHVDSYGSGTGGSQHLANLGQMNAGFDYGDSSKTDWKGSIKWRYLRKESNSDVYKVEWEYKPKGGSPTHKVDELSFDGVSPATLVVNEQWVISIEPDQPVPAKHSQKEVSAKLKIAIEKDSSIPDQEWQSLDARNQPIDHKKINGTTLTSAFISMRAPDEPDKPKSDELEVFKTSTVVRIIDEIERVKAPYTFIHADRITDLDFKIDNDTAQGTFSFVVPDLYKGKFGYRAKLTESDWRITEFLLPAHGIHLVRDGDTWTNISLQ